MLSCEPGASAEHMTTICCTIMNYYSALEATNPKQVANLDQHITHPSQSRPPSCINLTTTMPTHSRSSNKPGSRVAGHRGYFLTGPAVMLNQAIINYALNFLRNKDYVTVQTPFFMNKEIMARTAQLSDFDEQLYKVTDGDDEKYLIATSEQPLSAFNMNSNIPKKDLPLKYAGYSTNFRKEAGGHGRDVWGIFRVHQFEKIEQFCITAPEESEAMHQQMLETAQEFMESLGIAYRVVDIVSGELNDAAARKYDLEGWYPCLNEYRELVSCSNCTDYQSRKLDIRFAFKNEEKEGEKYVHMLNSTLAATSRVLCCLLETYQTADGIDLPAALHPYLPGIPLN